MSLGPVYVLAVDGQYYENPVFRGRESESPYKRWFLCFDDSEPPELVIERGGALLTQKRAMAILETLGFKATLRNVLAELIGERIFDNEYQPAGAYWLKITAPIPVPTEHGGIVARTQFREGVIYDFKERGRR